MADTERFSSLQAESDFVSEWLTSAYPALGSVLTAGVGAPVPGGTVWVWEGTGAPLQYNLWWPGPPSKDFSPGECEWQHRADSHLPWTDVL